MPLRDFDQVRERIQLRVEVRHIVQAVLVLLTLVGAAFGVGVWYARQHPEAPGQTPQAAAAAQVAGPAPSAPAAAEAPSPAPEAPIVPTPVAVVAADVAVAGQDAEAVAAAPAPDVAAAGAPEPTAEQWATAPGERAVPPVDVARSAAPAAPTPPVAVATVADAVKTPAAVMAEAPEASTAVAVLPAAADAKAAPVVAPPAPLVAKATAPHGLSLFGTLRMAPTLVTVAQSAPAAAKPTTVAAADDKAHVTQVRKLIVRPREDDVRPTPVSGHYVIQVKAFRDEAEAKAFEADLRGKGHAPKLSSIEVPDKGTFYRVRMGPFDSLESARAAQKQFETAEGHVTILLAVP